MKPKSSIRAVVIGIALAGSANAFVLFSDNFTVTGTSNTYDINYNNSGRQGGTQATKAWSASGNAQVGNNSVFGGDGNYLMVADANGRATLATLNLAPLVASNEKLVISFDMYAAVGGYDWASFTLGGLTSGMGTAQPDTSATEFAFIYRNNTGIVAWDNGNPIANVPATTGGNHFTFTFSDAATQTVSPFGVDASVTIQNGLNTIGTYTLIGGLSSDTYITFGMTQFVSGGRGAIDNLVVQAIPEPGAALLGGIGLLMLVRRRR